MGKWIKKGLMVLLIGFLVFYLVTRPEQAADVVKSIFSLFEAIPRFFARLAQ